MEARLDLMRALLSGLPPHERREIIGMIADERRRQLHAKQIQATELALGPLDGDCTLLRPLSDPPTQE